MKVDVRFEVVVDKGYVIFCMWYIWELCKFGVEFLYFFKYFRFW